jgi:hypothetical protein
MHNKAIYFAEVRYVIPGLIRQFVLQKSDTSSLDDWEGAPGRKDEEDGVVAMPTKDVAPQPLNAFMGHSHFKLSLESTKPSNKTLNHCHNDHQ